jgi:hypothetical protein
MDIQQLELLIGEHDVSTGGYGAYWVGRAVCAANLSDDQPRIAFIKFILDRWRSEDRYGSETKEYEARVQADVHGNGTTNGHTNGNGRSNGKAHANGTGHGKGTHAAAAAVLEPPAPPAPAGETHPAVQRYQERLGRTLHPDQIAQIEQTVTDLDAWDATLAAWVLNDWKATSIGHMLDNYQKRLDAATPLSARLFVEAREQDWITGQEYSDWMTRFQGTAYCPTDATTKRTVLTEFRDLVHERKKEDP